MRLSLFATVFCCLSIAACSLGLSRDHALEARISKLVQADEVVAFDNFGQVAVNIDAPEVFGIGQKERMELAKRLAYVTLKAHPDASAILIGFGRVKPKTEQIGYGWSNNNGTLSPISH